MADAVLASAKALVSVWNIIFPRAHGEVVRDRSRSFVIEDRGKAMWKKMGIYI
jgi:hypothetical protein